jgi:hypothetical protein
MPPLSASVGFAVPISIPLNTSVESTLMISPPNSCASWTESAVFPEAVGPIKKMAGGKDCFFMVDINFAYAVMSLSRLKYSESIVNQHAALVVNIFTAQ